MAIPAEEWIPREEGPYKARSASEKTEDWPFWYVCGPDGRKNAMTLPEGHFHFGAAFTDRKTAEQIADLWNAKKPIKDSE